MILKEFFIVCSDHRRYDTKCCDEKLTLTNQIPYPIVLQSPLRSWTRVVILIKITIMLNWVMPRRHRLGLFLVSPIGQCNPSFKYISWHLMTHLMTHPMLSGCYVRKPTLELVIVARRLWVSFTTSTPVPVLPLLPVNWVSLLCLASWRPRSLIFWNTGWQISIIVYSPWPNQSKLTPILLLLYQTPVSFATINKHWHSKNTLRLPHRCLVPWSFRRSLQSFWMRTKSSNLLHHWLPNM